MSELMIWVLVGGAYFALAALNYCATFTYFQTEYALIADECRWGDRAFALLVAAVGPVGTLTILLRRGFRHGISRF
jgi:hypothetical protein